MTDPGRHLLSCRCHCVTVAAGGLRHGDAVGGPAARDLSAAEVAAGDGGARQAPVAALHPPSQIGHGRRHAPPSGASQGLPHLPPGTLCKQQALTAACDRVSRVLIAEKRSVWPVLPCSQDEDSGVWGWSLSSTSDTTASLQTRGFLCDCVFPEHCDSQGMKLPLTRMQQLELEARCAAGNSNGEHTDQEPIAALGDAAAPDSDDRLPTEATGVTMAICKEARLDALLACSICASHELPSVL